MKNRILGHETLTTCLDCNTEYMPMSRTTEMICPFCQQDLLIDDEIEQEFEEVSHDNLYWGVE